MLRRITARLKDDTMTTEPQNPSLERIGEYRIRRRLGSGGMGDVFLAWDERLERSVAVKRIRHGVETTPNRRRRFRREARAAASLSHPAIVQIYHVLEDEDGDSIVMEYVEGHDLAKRLALGTVDAALAIHLARQVTEGLAHAHAKGLVHRDLKTENVMVTPRGNAKILDFGLAKPLVSSDLDATLTHDGAVLGTVRAMSPEQAQGGAVNERSDLYSLGVLLYESLTGRSPFRGKNALQIHRKVLTERPPPPKALRPELPAELSELIEALLEKNPEHRPQSCREVAVVLEAIAARPEIAALGHPPALLDTPELPSDAPTAPPTPRASSDALGTTARPPNRIRQGEDGAAPGPPPWRLAAGGLAVLAIAIILAFAWPSPPGEPIYVAVAEPRVQGESLDQDGALLAAAAKAAALDGLLRLEQIVPLTAEEIDPPPASVPELVRALAAHEVVTTRLDCHKTVCQVTLRRLSTDGRQVIDVTSFQIPNDDLFLLASAVASHVREMYPRRTSRPGIAAPEIPNEAYARYFETLLAQKKGSLERQDALEILGEIRRNAPLFVDVYVAEAFLLYERYFLSRDPRDLDRAFELLGEARRLEPENPHVLLKLATVAVETGHLEEAASTLDTLERLEPGDAQILALRALVDERRGDVEKALASMRTAVKRWPSRNALFNLAHMEYRQGQIDATRATLERLLRPFPEHFQARSFLAQLELMEGSPARAEELYLELVERSPGIAELSNLSLARLLQGDYNKAVGSALRAYELAPENPGIALNLADARLLNGEDTRARELYERIVELVGEAAATDWQQATVKAQALAHLGRSREAVAAIQRALELTPGNPQVAYEAALVYAVVGERASALVHAEKAREAFGARWLTLPWFESLGDDRQFRALLEP